MGNLSRIGVAIDRELLRRFDRFIQDKGHQSRSDAFRDLICERLAIVTLSYDHSPKSSAIFRILTMVW
jgi:metal-responsive CopG/Arc/MetJ family transcriptional regulator